jgi:hypothetical protein
MATQSVKDILGTEIPDPAFSVSFNRQAPLPPEMTFQRAGKAWQYNPSKGQYESVPAGTLRRHGNDGAALIERSAATNYVPWSNDFSQWNTFNGASVNSQNTPLLEGKQAYLVEANGTNSFIGLSAGTFSGSKESAYFIFERAPKDSIDLEIRNTDQSSTVIRARYTFGSGASIVGGSGEAHFRVLEENGALNNPNSSIIALEVLYTGTGGDGRAINVYPDPVGGDNQSTFHHAQINHWPTPSSPFPTSGSAEEREPDELKLTNFDAYTSRKSTFLAVITPTLYSQKFSDAGFLGTVGGEIFGVDVGSEPFGFQSSDRTNQGLKIDNFIEPYEKTRLLAGFTESKRKISANNTTASGAHDGDLNDESQFPRTLGFNSAPFLLHELRYYPEYMSNLKSEVLA